MWFPLKLVNFFACQPVLPWCSQTSRCWQLNVFCSSSEVCLLDRTVAVTWQQAVEAVYCFSSIRLSVNYDIRFSSSCCIRERLLCDIRGLLYVWHLLLSLTSLQKHLFTKLIQRIALATWFMTILFTVWQSKIIGCVQWSQLCVGSCIVRSLESWTLQQQAFKGWQFVTEISDGSMQATVITGWMPAQMQNNQPYVAVLCQTPGQNKHVLWICGNDMCVGVFGCAPQRVCVCLCVCDTATCSAGTYLLTFMP
jgi:hypothetical protein